MRRFTFSALGRILNVIQKFTMTLNWKIMPGHVGKDAWARRKKCLGTSEKMPGHVENEAWGVRSQPSPQFNMGSVIRATGESWRSPNYFKEPIRKGGGMGEL